MIDKDTGLLYVIKRPTPEKRKYGMDFRRLLSAVQSVDSVTIVPAGELVAGVPTFADSVVSFDLSGGVAGSDYIVTVSVTDLTLNIISESLLIKIRV